MYHLYYADSLSNELGEARRVDCDSFESMIDYIDHLHSLNINTGNRKVYLLTVGDGVNRRIYIEESSVHLQTEILPIHKAYTEFYLQEYNSYEEAYKVALNMREESDLCYNN